MTIINKWEINIWVMNMEKIRGFEKVSFRSEDKDVILPERKTRGSAAYDVHSPEEIIIKPGEHKLLHTGIKAYFQEDEALFIIPRSSIGIKHGIRLMNTIGLVDSVYYNNKSNEGEIIFALENNGKEEFKISKGDRVCQVYFQKILFADDDSFSNNERAGGFRSTGRSNNQ